MAEKSQFTSLYKFFVSIVIPMHMRDMFCIISSCVNLFSCHADKMVDTKASLIRHIKI